MDTKDLKAFKTVFELQSINAAAGELYVSPQGLSKRIQKLEEDLETPLFIRSAQGMIPTECGKMLYHNVNVFYDFYDQVKKSIHNGCREMFLPLIVAAPTGLLASLSVSFLLDFRNEYPDIPLKYTEHSDDEVLTRVASGDAALGIVHGPIDTTQFSAEYLYSTPIVAVLPKLHPLTIREKLSFEDFNNVPVCLLGSEYRVYQQFINSCMQKGSQPIVRLEAPDSRTIVALALSHGTAGILSGTDPAVYKSEELTGDYEIRPFSDPGFKEDLWIVYKRGTLPRKEAAAFLTYACEKLHFDN